MATITGERASYHAEHFKVPRVARLALSLPRLGLSLILLLSAVLEFAGLTDEGYANSYYAAGVKSMLTSWHNFFFVSYDAGGFVSLDKPPLGLWIEAASARLFGFSGFSLLLPEALAGVLSVALLYHLVARSWGQVAGLVAALALAVTPISVVTDRNNTIDSLLILTLLLAAWAASLAAERGSLRHLLICAAGVGLGFNIKMLQAYLVLPAFGAMYLLGTSLPVRRRPAHLAAATAVLLAVSLSWAVVVDLTPASQRPFISDSGTNSELSLALGYNGLGRFTEALFPGVKVLHILGMNIDLTVAPAFAADIGDPGFFRLLSPTLGGQVGWLLPLALLGIVAAALRLVPPGTRARVALDRRGQSLLLWGGWLLVAGFFFSTARFFHLYYLVMLAPAIAALAGVGMHALWSLYRQRSERGRWPARVAAWLLPAALLVTAGVQASFLGGYTDQDAWLRPLMLGTSIVAALVLVAGRLRLAVLVAPGRLLGVTRPVALAASTLGLMSLLFAPATWAAISVANGNGGAWLPQAGSSTGFGGGPGLGGRGGFGGGGRAFAFPGGPGSAQGSRQQPSGGQPAQPGGMTGFGANPPSGTGASGPTGTRGFGGGFGGGGGFGSGGALTYAGKDLPTLDAGLLRYLAAHRGTARFLVATMTSSYASLFILQAGQPAMALGGYQGWDRIVTPTELAQLVTAGTVRFFYIPAASARGAQAGFPGQQPGTQGQTAPRAPGTGAQGVTGAAGTNLANTNNDLTRWVQTSCTAVPAKTYQRSTTATPSTGRGTGRGESLQLYDCARAGAKAGS